MQPVWLFARPRVGTGLKFRAGQTQFRIVLEQPAAVPGRSRLARRGKLAGGFLVAATVAGLIVFSSSVQPSSVSLKRPDRTMQASAIQPAMLVTPELDPAAAARLFSAHLASNGLASVLVVPGAQGAVEADGHIDPGQKIAWDSARHWFDASFGAQYVLLDRLSTAAPAVPLSVMAVWAGPSPYVIDRNGERLVLGTVLPSGWTLDRIEAERLLLSRAGQHLVVRF